MMMKRGEGDVSGIISYSDTTAMNERKKIEAERGGCKISAAQTARSEKDGLQLAAVAKIILTDSSRDRVGDD
jgi:hypothetical protein